MFEWEGRTKAHQQQEIRLRALEPPPCWPSRDRRMFPTIRAASMDPKQSYPLYKDPKIALPIYRIPQMFLQKGVVVLSLHHALLVSKLLYSTALYLLKLVLLVLTEAVAGEPGTKMSGTIPGDSYAVLFVVTCLPIRCDNILPKTEGHGSLRVYASKQVFAALGGVAVLFSTGLPSSCCAVPTISGSSAPT